MLSQNVGALGASGRMAPTPTIAIARCAVLSMTGDSWEKVALGPGGLMIERTWRASSGTEEIISNWQPRAATACLRPLPGVLRRGHKLHQLQNPDQKSIRLGRDELRASRSRFRMRGVR